jgi:hypothetical protein
MMNETLIERANKLSRKIDESWERPDMDLSKFNALVKELRERGVEVDEVVRCPENW